MSPGLEWTWNHRAGLGYDGVHTREGPFLVWYTHRHHTLEGGGARIQQFGDLLRDGPPVPVPDDILAEVMAHARERAAASD